MALSGRARVMGVFGYPVGHSLSPAMHNAAIQSLDLDCIYVPFNVPPDGLRAAVDGIRALGLTGVNVTIPHKQSVIALLDEVEDDARTVGSVNTIVNDGGRLIGSSTDGPGFLRSLEQTGFRPDGSRAVVLGSGGAGRAVAFALAGAGAEVVLYDESRQRSECLSADLHAVFGEDSASVADDLPTVVLQITGAGLLVNCTPVGMSPRADESPVPGEALREGLLVYDLVYTPLRTKLVREAERAGARAVSGLKMLVYQGAISFEKWTGVAPPVEVMESAVLAGLAEQ